MTGISIVIPVYNAEKWLRTAISSALCQAPETGCEVIVVDDGSTDASSAIIAEYGDAITAVYQINRGASAARNAGITRASGEYIKFLDADDYLLPGSLVRQLTHARTLDRASISFGRMFRHEEDGRIVPHGTRDAMSMTGATERPDLLLLEAPVLPSILYPKKFLEQSGGFDERLGFMDDFDVFMRALLAGRLFEPFGQPISVYRNHPSGERLSAKSERDDFSRVIGMFGRHIAELEGGARSRATAGIRSGLGGVIWIIARRALRFGHKDEARALFALAWRAAGRNPARGHPLCKAMSRLLGPIAAEEILEQFKVGPRGWRERMGGGE
jgi:glycosyltransferase involved in cell wall biosynthesis